MKKCGKFFGYPDKHAKNTDGIFSGRFRADFATAKSGIIKCLIIGYWVLEFIWLLYLGY